MDEHLCPYCNAIAELQLKCPACGSRMEDCGALQNVLGPYAPYEEPEMVMQHETCIHQIYCPLCDEKYQINIPDYID